MARSMSRLKIRSVYDKTIYQWHFDWHFLQRTEEDCWNLFAEAGYDSEQITVTRDETGIIMNFVWNAGGDPLSRVGGNAWRWRSDVPHVFPRSPRIVDPGVVADGEVAL